MQMVSFFYSCSTVASIFTSQWQVKEKQVVYLTFKADLSHKNALLKHSLDMFARINVANVHFFAFLFVVCYVVTMLFLWFGFGEDKNLCWFGHGLKFSPYPTIMSNFFAQINVSKIHCGRKITSYSKTGWCETHDTRRYEWILGFCRHIKCQQFLLATGLPLQDLIFFTFGCPKTQLDWTGVSGKKQTLKSKYSFSWLQIVFLMPSRSTSFLFQSARKINWLWLQSLQRNINI